MKDMFKDNLDEIVELFRQDSDHESKGQSYRVTFGG